VTRPSEAGTQAESPIVDTANTPDSSSTPRASRLAVRARLAAARTRSVAIRSLRWLALHGMVAALSVGAGLLVVALATEYGFHPNRNASTWAGQPMRYASTTACRDCHAAQAATAVDGRHDQVSCQACHGPMADHARTASPPNDTAAIVPVSAGRGVAAAAATTTGSALCLVCHETVIGRPTTVEVISPTAHYGGGDVECVICHDPHGTAAATPPIVRHELEGLPDCLVCHGPGGLRAMTPAHPSTGTIDCLLCHLRRAGATP